MRKDLVEKYYWLTRNRDAVVNPNASGIRPERLEWAEVKDFDAQIAEVIAELLKPENREQPRDEWERQHGVWLLTNMRSDGYLPGSLLRVQTGTEVYDGQKMRHAVLASSMINRGGRTVVLLFNEKGNGFLGAELVTPSDHPLLM